MSNRRNTYITFCDDNVDDAADDRDEVEYVPRVTEVILSQQPTTSHCLPNVYRSVKQNSITWPLEYMLRLTLQYYVLICEKNECGQIKTVI